MAAPVTLPTLLGDYPVTRALRRGEITSPAVQLSFADVTSAAAGFKRAVRALEFDVAELAIVTFLIAKAHPGEIDAAILGRDRCTGSGSSTGGSRWTSSSTT